MMFAGQHLIGALMLSVATGCGIASIFARVASYGVLAALLVMFGVWLTALQPQPDRCLVNMPSVLEQ